MAYWRNKLHRPESSEDLYQEKFSKAVRTACDVLSPSIDDKDASSACVLLIGPPSSGKSLLTRLLIDKLEHITHREVVVVHLTGLLHSTPTRAWQQLARVLIDWYESQCRTNDAISPDDLIGVNGKDENDADKVDQYRDAMTPALHHLKNSGAALLLVLDQLHRFASADPLAQTVLYSLFNLLQDRSLRAACVAQTSYIDVTDLLEKRVLSRLSHRKIIVPLIESSDQVICFLSTALAPVVANQSASRRSRGRELSRERGRKGGSVHDSLHFLAKELLEHDEFATIVRTHMARTRVIAPILRAVDAALTMTAPSEDAAGSSAVSNALRIVQSSLSSGDSTVDTVTSLTHLQLSLLVALRRVEGARIAAATRKEGDNSSVEKGLRLVFGDVFSEYCKLGQMDDGRMAEQDLAQSVADRPVAERAWEVLIESGIVVRTGTGPRDSRPVYCAIAVTQIDAAFDKHVDSLTVLKNWAKRAVTR